MRTKLILFVAAMAAMPMLAWADVPPPPDDYSGPPSAHIAGLTFEHQRIRHEGPAGAPELHLLDYGTYVFLTKCDAKSKYCAAATKLGAIGGAVTKIDTVTIADNVQSVIDALKPKGKHTLTIVLAGDVIVQPENPQTVTLVVKTP